MVFSLSCESVSTYYRVRTELSSLAFLAMLSYPDIIELVHGLFDNFWVICQDASFKVALVVRFHTNSCTCQVRTSNKHFLAVKDKHLEMNTRTENSFQAVIQHWVPVKILTKVWTWFFCMNEPYLHTTPDKGQ